MFNRQFSKIWQLYISKDLTGFYIKILIYHLSLFEMCAFEICVMFVYKHTETIEYVKKQPIFGGKC